MTETARALNAKEVSELIHNHLDAFLDGGPDREAEDIELGQAVGLKVEGISARWADAREYLLLTPPASKAAPLTGAEKAAEEVERLTALPAQEAVKVKVADVDSVDAWGREKRRRWGEPAASKPNVPPNSSAELVKKVLDKKKAEASLFLNTAQPEAVEPEVTTVPATVGSMLLDRVSSDIGKPSAIAPGVLGEIAEYVCGSAMYPSKLYAAAVGLGVIGTLIGRRIAGPSGARGTGTHLYQAIIGPTGSGKEHVRTTSKILLSAAGASALIGPGSFKSGPGIMKHLEKKPCSLCVIDELGAYLAKITDRKSPGYEKATVDILREVWGLSWGRYDSPEGASDESKSVMSPALSLIGMSTPKELYRACKSRDVTNGFLNRWIFIEEKAAPAYQRVSEGSLDVPRGLCQSLKKLFQPISLQDRTFDQCKPALRMEWGRGAEEIYNAIRESVERETDERRKELFWRTPEKIVRVATDVAAGCLSKIVTRDHMEWARDWVQRGDETLLVGVSEYMEEEKLEFAELCREIIRRVRQAGGVMKHRDVGRSFQNNLRYKRDLHSALEHLVDTGQLIFNKELTGGRPSPWYSLPKDEGNVLT